MGLGLSVQEAALGRGAGDVVSLRGHRMAGPMTVGNTVIGYSSRSAL